MAFNQGPTPPPQWYQDVRAYPDMIYDGAHPSEDPIVTVAEDTEEVSAKKSKKKSSGQIEPVESSLVAWLLQKANVEGQAKPTWENVVKDILPFDTLALTEEIKKHNSKHEQTAYDAYIGLTPFQKKQLDRLLEKQKRQESNPNADWSLAHIRKDMNTKKKHDTLSIQVTLRRQDKHQAQLLREAEEKAHPRKPPKLRQSVECIYEPLEEMSLGKTGEGEGKKSKKGKNAASPPEHDSFGVPEFTTQSIPPQAWRQDQNQYNPPQPRPPLSHFQQPVYTTAPPQSRPFQEQGIPTAMPPQQQQPPPPPPPPPPPAAPPQPPQHLPEMPSSPNDNPRIYTRPPPPSPLRVPNDNPFDPLYNRIPKFDPATVTPEAGPSRMREHDVDVGVPYPPGLGSDPRMQKNDMPEPALYYGGEPTFHGYDSGQPMPYEEKVNGWEHDSYDGSDPWRDYSSNEGNNGRPSTPGTSMSPEPYPGAAVRHHYHQQEPGYWAKYGHGRKDSGYQGGGGLGPTVHPGRTPRHGDQRHHQQGAEGQHAHSDYAPQVHQRGQSHDRGRSSPLHPTRRQHQPRQPQQQQQQQRTDSYHPERRRHDRRESRESFYAPASPPPPPLPPSSSVSRDSNTSTLEKIVARLDDWDRERKEACEREQRELEKQQAYERGLEEGGYHAAFAQQQRQQQQPPFSPPRGLGLGFGAGPAPAAGYGGRIYDRNRY
ncbi:hypothetical protein MBLNU459_g3236t1 [Dothideomycetes sp. NU459]